MHRLSIVVLFVESLLRKNKFEICRCCCVSMKQFTVHRRRLGCVAVAVHQLAYNDSDVVIYAFVLWLFVEIG